MNKYLVPAIILLSFNPWIGSAWNTLDVQPYILILLLAWATLNPLRLSGNVKTFILLLLPGLLVTLLWTNQYNLFYVIRYFVYICMMLLLFLFYKKIGKNKLLSRLIFVSNLIWILVGILQKYISIDIFSFLVRNRTTIGRGVTSLAPEASYYGIVFVIFSLIYFYCDIKLPFRSIYMHFINIVALIFFASMLSSTIIALPIYLIGFTKRTTINVKLSYPFVLIGLSSLIFIVFSENFVEFIPTRFASNFFKLFNFNQFFTFMQYDHSFNERAMHIFLPLKTSLDHFFLPLGASSFDFLGDITFKNYSDLFIYTPSNKIMCWTSEFFYINGVFFLPLIYLVSSNIRFHPNFFRLVLSFFFLLLLPIPLGFPPLIAYYTLLHITPIKYNL